MRQFRSKAILVVMVILLAASVAHGSADKAHLDEAIKKIKSQVMENNSLGTKIQELEVLNVDLQAELLQTKGDSPLSEEDVAKLEQEVNTLGREKKHLEVDLREKDAEIQMLHIRLSFQHQRHKFIIIYIMRNKSVGL